MSVCQVYMSAYVRMSEGLHARMDGRREGGRDGCMGGACIYACTSDAYTCMYAV